MEDGARQSLEPLRTNCEQHRAGKDDALIKVCAQSLPIPTIPIRSRLHLLTWLPVSTPPPCLTPCLQIPYFLGVHLFLGRSYAYGRGFNRAQEAQDCCATPASPLSSTVASVIVTQTFLRGIPLHLKPQRGQLHI